MTVSYDLGCPIRTFYWDTLGEQAALARMFTYRADDHNVLRPTYKNGAGTIPQPNPIIFNAFGKIVDPVYFENNSEDDGYYIRIETAEGVLIDDIDFYKPPITSQVSPSTENIDFNYIRNPQFNIWAHTPMGFPDVNNTLDVSNVTASIFEEVLDDWVYLKNNSNAQDRIIRGIFAAGQADVPANPNFYARIQCTSPGAAETAKQFGQNFVSAQFLAGQTVTISFWARCDVERTIGLLWLQNFGTGGSPSPDVTSTLATFQVGPTFQQYTTTVTIPTIENKDLGTDNNSFTRLLFNLPIGAVYYFDVTNVQLQQGTAVNVFQQGNYEKDYEGLSWFLKHSVGDMKFNPQVNGSVPPEFSRYVNSRWLEMEDDTIGRPGSGAAAANLAYAALYCFLWSQFADGQCPVSGGRGTSAIADWNAGKTLRLPLTMSRLIGCAGTGAGLTARANGETGGRESHNEIINHTHTVREPFIQPAFFGGGTDRDGPLGFTDVSSSAPVAPVVVNSINIMNPFSFLALWIHY